MRNPRPWKPGCRWQWNIAQRRENRRKVKAWRWLEELLVGDGENDTPYVELLVKREQMEATQH